MEGKIVHPRMKTRNHAFDLLCGLCILRMILLHVMGMCGYRGEF